MDTLTSFITTHKLQGYEAIPAFIAANHDGIHTIESIKIAPVVEWETLL